MAPSHRTGKRSVSGSLEAARLAARRALTRRGGAPPEAGDPAQDEAVQRALQLATSPSGGPESDDDSFPSMASFSDEQWRTLQFAPVWTFILVAGADGEIDYRERGAYTSTVLNATPGSSRLVLDVLAYHALDIGKRESACREDPREPVAGLADVADVLDTAASGSDALAFKEAMLELGTRVAGASGPLVGSKVSTEEREALQAVSRALRLEG